MRDDTNLVNLIFKHRAFIHKIAEMDDYVEYSSDCLQEIIREARKFLEDSDVIVDLQPKSYQWIKFDKDDHTTWPLDDKLVIFNIRTQKNISRNCSFFVIGSLILTPVNMYKSLYRVFTNDRSYEKEDILYWMPLSELPEIYDLA